MTHEVCIKVYLQVDSDEELTTKECQDTVHKAIKNAVNFAANNGFTHPKADTTSIGVVSVEVGGSWQKGHRFLET